MGANRLHAIAGWGLGSCAESLVEPMNIDTFLPDALNHSVSSGKLVSDAYLAAFAMSDSRRLVTFDRDFRRFRGLDVQLLA